MRVFWVVLFCLPAAAQDDLVAALEAMPPAPRPWRNDPVVKAFGVLSPPADDAPLDELLDYWEPRRDGESPSPEVRRRLLEACRDAPRMLPSLLGWFPRTA